MAAAAQTGESVRNSAVANGISVASIEPTDADLLSARTAALNTVEARLDTALTAGNWALASSLGAKRSETGVPSSVDGTPPTEADVRRFQAFFGITETGYGPQTRAKVAELQRDLGLSVDKYTWIGPNTLQGLAAAEAYKNAKAAWWYEVDAGLVPDATTVSAMTATRAAVPATITSTVDASFSGYVSRFVTKFINLLKDAVTPTVAYATRTTPPHRVGGGHGG
jgi:hypothetical protein